MGSPRIQRWLWHGYGRLINRGTELRDLLDAHGIIVFVGPNGSGKSLLCVEAALPTLAGKAWECADLAHLHNRPVKDHCRECAECVTAKGDESFCPAAVALLEEHGRGLYLVHSTLPLVEAATGRPHPLYRPLTRIPELVAIEHAVVIFDEVSGVCDAADSATVPAALRRWLQQLRKRDVRLLVTSPAFKRCALPVRQVVTLVVDVRSFFKEDGFSGRQWIPRRAMLAEAYDAFEFRDFDKNSGDTLPSLAKWAYWRADHEAMNAYNTVEQVHALIDVEEGGACSVCNGSRSKPACGCGPEVYDVPIDELTIVTETGPRGGRVRKAVLVGTQ